MKEKSNPPSENHGGTEIKLNKNEAAIVFSKDGVDFLPCPEAQAIFKNGDEKELREFIMDNNPNLIGFYDVWSQFVQFAERNASDEN